MYNLRYLKKTYVKVALIMPGKHLINNKPLEKVVGMFKCGVHLIVNT